MHDGNGPVLVLVPDRLGSVVVGVQERLFLRSSTSLPIFFWFCSHPPTPHRALQTQARGGVPKKEPNPPSLGRGCLALSPEATGPLAAGVLHRAASGDSGGGTSRGNAAFSGGPRRRPPANLGPPAQANVASHLINVAALRGGRDNQADPPKAEFPSRA